MILKYEVDTGEHVIDSVGNEAPVREIKIIKASVARDELQADRSDLPGSGLYELRLKGRLSEPKLMPSWLNLQMIADAQLVDDATGNILNGEFQMQPVNQNRFKEFSEHMGSLILGIFTVNGV